MNPEDMFEKDMKEIRKKECVQWFQKVLKNKQTPFRKTIKSG